MKDTYNDLSQIGKQLMLNEPFYGVFLSTLNKVIGTSVPTAGVCRNGINYQLIVNEEFWNSLNTDKKKVGLLKHELLHICFGHLNEVDNYPDHELHNIAADVEINQYLTPDYYPTKDILLPSTFPELKLPLKAGTKKYYELLQQAKKDGTSPSLDALLDSDPSSGGSHGSIAGGLHPTWSEFENLSEADKKLIKSQIEHQIKNIIDSQGSNIRGFVPSELQSFIDEILAVNSISLKLYFKTIQPLEFVDVEGMNKETTEEETGVKMCSHNLASESIADALIDKGEDLSDDWFLIDETEVDYDTEEELDAEINTLNNKKKSTLSKMWKFITSTGTARPNIKDKEQDKVIDGVQFITRYVYSGDLTGEREFCNKMLRAGKVYRKEDIVAMESKVVNSGFGKGGSDTYSIWLWKGGPRCNHKWLRRTYASFDGIKIDPTNPNAKAISSATAEKYGYRIRNDKEVSMKPSDMPTKGYTQEYWDKMGYTN